MRLHVIHTARQVCPAKGRARTPVPGWRRPTFPLRCIHEFPFLAGVAGPGGQPRCQCLARLAIHASGAPGGDPVRVAGRGRGHPHAGRPAAGEHDPVARDLPGHDGSQVPRHRPGRDDDADPRAGHVRLPHRTGTRVARDRAGRRRSRDRRRRSDPRCPWRSTRRASRSSRPEPGRCSRGPANSTSCNARSRRPSPSRPAAPATCSSSARPRGRPCRSSSMRSWGSPVESRGDGGRRRLDRTLYTAQATSAGVGDFGPVHGARRSSRASTRPGRRPSPDFPARRRNETMALWQNGPHPAAGSGA